MRLVGMIPALISALALAGCGGEAAMAPAAPVPVIPAPTLAEQPAPYSSADLTKGKELFGRKCAACHTLDKAKGNQVGPNLHAVFDRGTAAAEGYKYSPALLAFVEPSWTPELIDQWLLAPDSFVPGTAMRLNGITDETERRDLIAYLLIASRQ